MKQYTASTNDEYFTNTYGSEQEAIDDMAEDLDPNDNFYVGEIKEIKVIDLISSYNLIEGMQETAGEKAGEASEDYLADLTEGQIGDLEKHIAEWFIKNKFKPNFYEVDNIKHFTILEDKSIKQLN